MIEKIFISFTENIKYQNYLNLNNKILKFEIFSYIINNFFACSNRMNHTYSKTYCYISNIYLSI